MTRSQITKPIAVFYEHQQWFLPLFAKLEERGIPYVRIDAREHSYDPSAVEENYSLFFNRMSASAYLRNHGNAIFYTLNYLAHLERSRVPIVNGRASFMIETSKALQLSLFERLGVLHPRSKVINTATEASKAAQELRFPSLIKPNVGGRGAGIVRFDTPQALERAAHSGSLDLGVDQTALVQEYVPARGGYIMRVEVLGGKFLYAIKVFTTGDNFNLCPAEFCQVGDGVAVLDEMCLVDAPASGLQVEAFTPQPDMIQTVERVAEAAGIDVGGVECLVDDRDGTLMYYDINALSNFVADAARVVGFDPYEQLVDYLIRRAA
ncbi:MAG TPA: hypothetical protein VE863_07820 [Pyrinomonadaceae bacterium]|jgi:glutathione synthase/RimK-type ligase-like ATP-grasp enzyme|nr:hypothetical protein [Pyrinomonadaceae bacterium]